MTFQIFYITLICTLCINCTGYTSLRAPSTLFRPTFSDSPLLSDRERHRLLRSTLEPEGDLEVLNKDSGLLPKFQGMSKIMYKFSRPHTIKGTILASIMSVSRAIREYNSILTATSMTALLPRAVIGMLALLCGNAYIVGINQIYDVKIDEINKPFLPIASKQLSPRNAWIVVLTCLTVGISIVKTTFSPMIFGLYMIGAFLGTIYSVPPFQFKRFPILAGSIIACVRGFLLNFGVYYAVREALQVGFQWNPVVAFISSFMTLFASVIAITKDLPDVEGDIKYGVNTFAAKYGVVHVAKGATLLLASAYSVAMTIPFTKIGVNFNKIPMIVGHAIALLYNVSIYKKLKTSQQNVAEVKEYYRSVWNMFYWEYLLYLFI